MTELGLIQTPSEPGERKETGNPFSTTILNWIKGIPWADMSQGLADGIDNADWTVVGTALRNTLEYLLLDVVGKIKWGAIVTELIGGLSEALASAVMDKPMTLDQFMIDTKNAEDQIDQFWTNVGTIIRGHSDEIQTAVIQTLVGIPGLIIGQIFLWSTSVITGFAGLIGTFVTQGIATGIEIVNQIEQWRMNAEIALGGMVATFLQKAIGMARSIITGLASMLGQVLAAVANFIALVKKAITPIVIGISVSIPWGKLGELESFMSQWADVAAGGGSKGGKPTGGRPSSKASLSTGSSCFLAGTSIKTFNGYEKIENLHSGQIVAGYDLEHRRIFYARISGLIRNRVSSYVTINKKIHTTAEHPFWCVNRNDWVIVNNLMIGDVLLNEHGDEIQLSSKTTVHEEAEVYNIEVEMIHNYFANGILVHNKKAKGGISYGSPRGHWEMLHGAEAVIPLENGRIPVDMRGGMVPAMAGAGTTIVIPVTYAPMVSTADEYEVKDKFGPWIADIVRQELGKRGRA